MAGRRKNRLHRTTGRYRRGKVARITFFIHFRDHYRTNGCGIRYRRSRNSAKKGWCHNVYQRQSAANKANKNIGKVHQSPRNSPFGHDRSGQNKERDRQQGELIHPAGQLDHHRFQRNIYVPGANDGANANRIRYRYPNCQHNAERKDENKCIHLLSFLKWGR